MTKPLIIATLLVYGLSAADMPAVWAQKPSQPPPSTPEEEFRSMQGRWYLLLAHESDTDLLDQPAYKHSEVRIAEKQFDWIAADGKTLFSAIGQWKHVGKPAWELDLCPANASQDKGQVKDVLPGIAVLYDKDVLKISWRRTSLEKGRATTFNGNREHTLLLLSRKPPAQPPAKATLTGRWQMLVALDDSFDKLGTGRSAAIAIFESDSFAWKSGPQDKGSRYAGTYRLDEKTQPARIQFNVAFPPPGSGATPTPKDGFVPGVFEFLDENTMRLCYRESGWKNSDPPESRQYPQGFYSDGDINLWILRRLEK